MRDLFSGLFTNSQAAAWIAGQPETNEDILLTSFCERLRCSIFHHVGGFVLPPFVLVFLENLKTLVVPVRLCERNRIWIFAKNGRSGRSDHDASDPG
jgi:hypothetical protein